MKKITFEDLVPFFDLKKMINFKIEISPKFSGVLVFIILHKENKTEFKIIELENNLKIPHSTAYGFLRDFLKWKLIYKIIGRRKEDIYRINYENPEWEEIEKLKEKAYNSYNGV